MIGSESISESIKEARKNPNKNNKHITKKLELCVTFWMIIELRNQTEHIDIKKKRIEKYLEIEEKKINKNKPISN